MLIEIVLRITLTGSLYGVDFLDYSFNGDLQILSRTSTEIELRNNDHDSVTVITGRGFTYSGGIPTGGTITGWRTTGPDELPRVSVEAISWSVPKFISAIDDENEDALMELLSSQNITVDACRHIGTLALIGDFVSSNITFRGSSFADYVEGGRGNDEINPSTSNQSDQPDHLQSYPGNDRYVFTNITPDNAYTELTYYNVAAGISVTLNGETNSGTVVKGLRGSGGTDTLGRGVPPLSGPV